MCRLATEETADANDRVVFLRFGEHASGRRNLKGPRHSNQRDIFFLGARAQQSVVSTLKEPFRDEGIESRNDDGETLASSAQIALQRRNRRRRNLLKLYFFFRSVSPRPCVSVPNKLFPLCSFVCPLCAMS